MGEYHYWTCCRCGARQAMTEEARRVYRQSSATFYCIHGHGNHYPQGKSEEEKLREQLNAERIARQRAEQRIAESATMPFGRKENAPSTNAAAPTATKATRPASQSARRPASVLAAIGRSSNSPRTWRTSIPSSRRWSWKPYHEPPHPPLPHDPIAAAAARVSSAGVAVSAGAEGAEGEMSDDLDRRCNNCLETGGVIRMWGAVHWCRQCATDAGEMGRRAIVRHDYQQDPEKFTPAVLKALANGPIMDSNMLYLPAGKLSQAEADAREQAMIKGE